LFKQGGNRFSHDLLTFRQTDQGHGLKIRIFGWFYRRYGHTSGKPIQGNQDSRENAI